MPLYAYTALGRDGSQISGQEFSDSRMALESSLKRRRLLLKDCKEVRPPKISLTVTLGLVEQLSQLIGSGIVVDRALQIIAEDAESKELCRLAQSLREGVKRGLSLSQTLPQVGRFDPLLGPLLKAGENSGRMSDILKALEMHFGRRQKLRRSIIGNLAYPMVLIAANLLSIIGLGIYVIPVFKGLFEDRMETLAASTRAVFWLSDLLLAHGVLLLLLLSLGGAAVLAAFRLSEDVREKWDRLLLVTPLIGAFLGKFQASKALSVLGLLLGSGVPLVSALELAQETLSIRPIRRGVAEVLQQIRCGGRFSLLVQQVPGFPKRVSRFVAVGEETGRLGPMCERLGETLGEECDGDARAFVSILEPVLIMFMGGVVAFVVVSMLLAVYSITDIG